MATIASVLVAGGWRRSPGDERAPSKPSRPSRQRERAEQNLYIARIGQAEGALRLFDPATARGLLDLCRPGPGEPDRRGWEWSYLDQWCNPELPGLWPCPPPDHPQLVAVSPDGRLLAVGCSSPFSLSSGEYPPVPAYLISLPEGRVRHELGGSPAVRARYRRLPARREAPGDPRRRGDDPGLGHRQRAGSSGPSAWASRIGPRDGGLSWSPDGRRLASVAEEGSSGSGIPRPGVRRPGLPQNARSVAWSPDGTRIASALAGDFGLEVRPWDAESERLLGPVLRQPG